MSRRIPLNKTELEQLDRELDAQVPVEFLSRLTLDRILSHLLFLFEVGEKTRTVEQLDQGALDVAICWAYKYCKKPNSSNLNLSFDSEIFRMALGLYREARHYRGVSGIMSLLFKSKLYGYRSGNVIDTALAAPFDVGMAAAEHLLFSSDDPTCVIPDNSEISKHYDKCKRRLVGKRKLEYTLSDELFQTVRALTSQLMAPTWQLDPLFEVGGYTLRDYRQFIESLAAYAQIHHYCNAAPPLQEIPLKNVFFDSLLRKASKAQWSRQLERLTGMQARIIDTIMDDITFNASSCVTNKPGNFMSLPFLRLTDEILVLSNRVAFESYAERNFWKLLSVKRPEVVSKLSLDKETLQIKGINLLLSENASTAHLKLLPRLNVQNKTDLDLLILDESNRFGLAIQLKWPYGPVYYQEMQNVWDEFKKGVEKLELTLPWLRLIPPVVVQESGIPKNVLQNFRFEAMVLSKNSVGFGWFNYQNDIPICSERFMKWALRDRQVPLQRFWELASTYAYKPKEGVHYRSKTIKPVFGDFSLEAPISFNILRDYDPFHDCCWEL